MKTLFEYMTESQINEMANSLSDFINKIDSLLQQMLENWCLAKWCDLFPNNNISKRLRNHWGTELKATMLQIVKIKLKSGRKDKAIKNILINKWELNDKSVIYDFINMKFTENGLFKYTNYMSDVCANNILEICNALSQDENYITDYINGELG